MIRVRSGSRLGGETKRLGIGDCGFGVFRRRFLSTVSLIMALGGGEESTKLKLYSNWRSYYSSRVRIALDLKGLDYKYIGVNLLKGEHKSPDVPHPKITDDNDKFPFLDPGEGKPWSVNSANLWHFYINRSYLKGATQEEKMDFYVKTAAQVIGSEEEAKDRMRMITRDCSLDGFGLESCMIGAYKIAGGGGNNNNLSSNSSGSYCEELVPQENFLAACNREMLARGTKLLKRTRKVHVTGDNKNII
ncbi:Glutathione S-transferase zeta-1 [Castilleja foliolosa]|uniref:Glutathione S-transferase zeta-1 n=1 Tax=Castilleja foliolosa TaxID=1961234 RepID=A0ABD3DUX4_9LAMI